VSHPARRGPSVYNCPNFREALVKLGYWTIEIVKRPTEATGFHLLPRTAKLWSITDMVRVIEEREDRRSGALLVG